MTGLEIFAMVGNWLSIAMSALHLKYPDGRITKSGNANTGGYLPPAIVRRVAQLEIAITKQPCECFDTASRYMRSAIEKYRSGELPAGDEDSEIARMYARGLRPCVHEVAHLRRQGSRI